jgi:putative membrane protein
MGNENRGILIALALLVLVVLAVPVLAGGLVGPGMMGGAGGMTGPGMMAGGGMMTPGPGGMMTPGAGGMVGPGMMGGAAPGAAGGWTWGLGMALGWLAMLAFWGALILGVVVVVRWLGGAPGRGGSAPETPLEILRRRYAAGEIDREQYEQMRQVLER